MNTLSIVFIGLLCVSVTLQQRIRHRGWNEFRLSHGKNYNSAKEEQARFQVWSARTAEIEAHNAKKGVSYTRTNHFHADFFDEELDNLRGLRLPKSRNAEIEAEAEAETFSVSADSLPSLVDWRLNGSVTAVKDQGQCGSCWTFSATGALEGQVYKKTGKLVSMSEQQFVDCVKGGISDGCNGGWMAEAFQYAKVGVNPQTAYTYVSGKTQRAQSSCKFVSNNVVTKTQSTLFKKVGSSDTSIKTALATVGPLAITVCANDNFLSYEGGIYTDYPCDSTSDDQTPNHAVLLVGYNTQDSKNKYWIVKNSWAASWGESGYIRIKMGRKLIGNAIYPIV